ncbi:MAG: hypothetical protein H6697_00460 [Myxococcales bacterium]|nr:hypothetical protein [Myxococcales bacterium]MCB9520019.1 hypothetical protein [Myxococcales bacterium]
MNHKQTPARLLALAAALAAACGGDDPTVPTGDTGTRPDSTTDAGGDATEDIVEDTGPTLPPTGESLYIAYVREATSTDPSLPNYRQLMIVDEDCRAANTDLCDPGSCDPVEVAPVNESEPLCNNGCALASDLSAIAFLDPDEPRTLRVARLGSDFQLSEDSRVVAVDVRDYQVQGRTLVYRVGEVLHAYDLGTDDDRVIGQFGNANGGFTLSRDASTLFLNDVTSLTAMNVSAIDIATGTSTLLYGFVSGERQGTGSFYSGREPMAVSPDGTRVAIVTDARTSGSLCASNVDCVDPGATCLLSATPPRCVRQELSVNIINLADASLLGSACSSDADCGADHFCDLTALDSNAQGECRPGRFSLGPSGPQACTSYAAGDYTEIRGPIAWRSDQTLLAVLGQTCATGNIDVTDVVALNLSGGAAFEPVIANPGLDHGDCFNDTESCWDPEQCVIEITSAAYSPSGHTVAFTGDSITSSVKDDLWLVDAWGRGGKQLLTRSIDFEVLRVSLHSRE